MDELQLILKQTEYIAGEDAYFQSLLTELEQLESEFDYIIQKLSNEEKRIIERYLTLCEESDYRKLQLAMVHFLNI